MKSRHRGVRLSRANGRFLGRGQARYEYQHDDYHQYPNQDIAISCVLLGMYAFPFVPLGHLPYSLLHLATSILIGLPGKAFG